MCPSHKLFQGPSRASMPVDEIRRSQSPPTSPQLRNLPTHSTATNQQRAAHPNPLSAQSTAPNQPLAGNMSSNRSTATNHPGAPNLSCTQSTPSNQQPNASTSSSTTNQHAVVSRSTNSQLPIQNAHRSTAPDMDPDSPPSSPNRVSTATNQQPLQPLTIRINNQRVSQPDSSAQAGDGDDENDGVGRLSKRRRVGTTTRGRPKRGRGGH